MSTCQLFTYAQYGQAISAAISTIRVTFRRAISDNVHLLVGDYCSSRLPSVSILRVLVYVHVPAHDPVVWGNRRLRLRRSESVDVYGHIPSLCASLPH